MNDKIIFKKSKINYANVILKRPVLQELTDFISFNSFSGLQKQMAYKHWLLRADFRHWLLKADFRHWLLRADLKTVSRIFGSIRAKIAILCVSILFLWIILTRESEYARFKRENKVQLFSFRNFFYPISKEQVCERRLKSLAFRFGSENSSALAAIIAMDKSVKTMWLQPICYLQFNNSIIVRQIGLLSPITHEKTSKCRLFQYRISCSSLGLNDAQIEAVKSQSDNFKFTLQIFDQEPVQVCLYGVATTFWDQFTIAECVLITLKLILFFLFFKKFLMLIL